MAHTLLFLLIKTNQLNAQLSDLRRLYPTPLLFSLASYEFRAALSLINYEDENCATLIELMQKAAINSFYLGNDVGKKLLVHMMTLHPTLVDHVHEAIKHQLPVTKAYITTAYAAIYFQV